MTLKDKLVQFCDIQLEIKELEKKIDKLEIKLNEIVTDVVSSTTKSFPIILNHAKISGTDMQLQIKIKRYKNILEERYAQLLETQVEIEQFINDISTSRLRRIFTYRYLDKMSWIKVASLIGGNATSDSVRKEHNRFLEKK